MRCFSEASTNEPRTKRKKDIKSTIGDIDALLGIEEEVKEEPEKKKLEAKDVTISADALAQLQQLQDTSSLAALEKVAKQNSANGELPKEDLERISAKLDKVKDNRLAKEVLGILAENGSVNADVVRTIKQDILGYTTFLVNDVKYLDGSRTGAVELRGNARKDPKAVADHLTAGLTERYGDKFVVYLLPEDEDPEAQADGKEKIVLQVLPKLLARPPPTEGWQVFVAIVLLLLTATSTASLAALVSVPKLPPETLAWLAAAEAAGTDAASTPIPGLDPTWNAIPFLSVFVDTFVGVASVNAVHELGHRIMAGLNGVRLGPSLNVPNGSLGSFGAVTPTETPFESRKQLFDVAASGPLAGFAVSLALFAYGLQLSSDPSTPTDQMLPVPVFLFQGSILLGSVCEGVLGVSASGKQLVHPFLIAGWCGLFTQAFNMLPVGALDGGRMVRSAYGPMAHRLTSVITYVGLALGFIGGALSLPFGLFVLLAQREPERYLLDQVTPTDNAREYVAAIFVILSILILIPFSPDAPELIDSLQFALQAQAVSDMPPPGSLSV